MRVLLTGAGGFVGQAVARKLAERDEVKFVRLLDLERPSLPSDQRFEAMAANLADSASIAPCLDSIDAVIHLASIPGGTAEQNPALSRLVNVDGTLALLEHLDAQRAGTRFVYASSIAVFGEARQPVDDLTIPTPSLVYGAHKRMIEIALGDFHRRGAVSCIALRLPGIVARPRGNTGLKSAFMSDVFHAAFNHEPFVMPVGPEATMWLMSAEQVAENLVHAMLLPDVDGQALTLPALRVTAQALVGALYDDPSRVDYAPDEPLQAKFGALPPLSTPAAESLGFAHDGALEALVAAVRASL